MPKLGYLLKKFPRLSETFVLNEILGQEQQGHDVHVFARRARDDEPLHPQVDRLRATVETLPTRHEIDPWTTLFSADWGSQALFDDLGRLVHAARDWQHPRFPSLLVEALYLLPRTRSLGIRHLHAHFATDSAFVAMLLHELGGPSYSITAHAKDIYRTTTSKSVLDRMFSSAEFVVTVCDANVRHLESMLSPEAASKVRRLYNGIDLEMFRDLGEPREPAHVLSVGRLVEKKGFFVLLEALRLLADREIPLRASIVGDGEMKDALLARRRELRLEESVEFLGPLDQGSIRSLMQRATLMCLPCLIGEDGNRDALPTVLLEALGSGLPCVSTPVTGIPEILDEGRAGLLAPVGDPDSLATAVRELLESPEKRRALATAGRARAEQEFDADKTSQTLSRWFAEAMRSTKARCESPA